MPSNHFSETYYQRSREVLTSALADVAAYRDWRGLDPGEDAPVDRRYAALPALTKQILTEYFPHGLVPRQNNVTEALKSGEIEFVETSGTTSDRITNIWNQVWWDASEAASWKLNVHTQRLDGRHPEAILTSALNVGFRSKADLPFGARRLGRFLYLNEKAMTQELTDRHFERMARELEEFRPVLLEANASWLARLAWWASDRGVKLAAPQAVVYTYELPSALHLASIRRVLPVPFISSYGSTETGYVFMQCEHGHFHQNTEYCRVDYEPLRPEHGGPDLGRILVTTFQNPWTILVRFDVGDLVRLAGPEGCPCGRKDGLVLSAIEGRLANATYSTAGRLITPRQADEALAQVPGLRDYQVEQTGPEDYKLSVMPELSARGVSGPARDALAAVYGLGARIATAEREDLLPWPSGKFRRTRLSFELEPKGLFA
ncbi:MAG: hypothetical protein AB1439_12155 [candidate division FCPU426 bacterium]